MLALRSSPLANAFTFQPMFENATDQQQADSSTDHRGFVTAVRDGIVSIIPELATDPTLLGRLTAAYREAKRIGLTQDELLAEFLYLETEVPGFYREPAVSAWLQRPGASINRRFKDLLEVLRKNLDETGQER